MYEYKAKVTNVYDGDTITIDIDLGMHAWMKDEKIRLYGINTPEIRGSEREQGLKSRDYLRDLILDKEIILQTIKDKKEKHGRYLGVIWLFEIKDNKIIKKININEKLVNDGYAQYKDY